MTGFPGRAGFIAGALTCAGLIGVCMTAVDRSPLKHLTLLGDLSDRQSREVRKQLAEFSGAPAGVREVKARLESNSWLRHADVAKQWPSGLVVSVFPQRVVAYWNDNGFVSEESEVLVTDLLHGGDLPHLYGPVDSASEVMRRFRKIGGALGRAGLGVEVLRLSDLGTWSLETEDGLQVFLGRQDIMQRVERFLKVATKLEEQGVAFDRADARYPSGVAVNVGNEPDDRLEVARIISDAREYGL